MTNATPIDVCVCTYRRRSLEATILSLGPQLTEGRRLIVVDNDDQPSSRALVEAVCSKAGVPYLFVHAPARNISLARNAALDASRADYLAFIDDDETAAGDWLDHLEACALSTSADVVLGVVEAVYPEGAPAWLARADLHSIRPVVVAPGVIQTGYCCNVLVRRAAIGDVRFDLTLGRSGGEDTVFFRDLHAAGRRIVACEDAVTRETVVVERQSLRWLLRRFFRSGQTHAITVLRTGGPSVRQAPLAAAKTLFCLGAALFSTGSEVRWRRHLVRAALHGGAVARYLGLRSLRLY